MSLYRFFETNIKENPDLLIITHENPVKSDELYNYYLNKVNQVIISLAI